MKNTYYLKKIRTDQIHNHMKNIKDNRRLTKSKILKWIPIEYLDVTLMVYGTEF